MREPLHEGDGRTSTEEKSVSMVFCPQFPDTPYTGNSHETSRDGKERTEYRRIEHDYIWLELLK
jgi:hypothetical protein